MITIKRYTDDCKEQWNEFCQQSRNGIFMFCRNYMEYHKDRFIDHSLMFYLNEEVVAILPMSIHGKEAISHGGLTYGGLIVGERMKQHTLIECFSELRSYCRNNGIMTIIYKNIPHIYHKYPTEEDIYGLFLNDAEIYKIEPSTVVDLKKPMKMPKGRKAQISRAKREGVKVERCEDFEAFIDLENSVLQKYHDTMAVHSGDELRLLKSRFPENIHLYAAFYKEKMIAGVLILEYENVIHTQYMASDDLSREIGGLDYTVYTIINDYKDSKQWLDFGISTEESGRVLNEGLISQKEGFGGRTNVYITWKLKI